MKIIYLSIIICISTFSQLVQAQNANPQLDTALARKLGADDYGMKSYMFVVLKSGENKTANKAFKDSCFSGHMANISKLAAANQLVIAGPFLKNEADLRGLFILNVKTVEEAKELLNTDPAIKTNLLKAEIYPWYGSAALSEYLPVHDKIWKSNP
jgi:uncharacterized protein YciI